MGKVSPRTCAGCLVQLLLKVLWSLRWETARISLSGQTQEDQNNALSGHRVLYLSRELFGDRMNRGSHLRPEKSHLGAALGSLTPPWHAWGPLLGDRSLSIVSFLPRPQGASSPACPRDALPSLALVASVVRPMTLSSRELISLCNYTFSTMIVSVTSAPP